MRKVVLVLIGVLIICWVAAKSEAQNNAKLGFVDIDVVGSDGAHFDDATIHVDGKDVGLAPITGLEVSIGPGSKSKEINIKVETKAGDYSDTKKVTVEPNNVHKVRLMLRPSEAQTTKIVPLIVDQQHGAVLVVVAKELGHDTIVSIDNAGGKGSLRISNLAVGPKYLIVRNERLRKIHTSEFTLKKGETWIFWVELAGIRPAVTIPPKEGGH